MQFFQEMSEQKFSTELVLIWFTPKLNLKGKDLLFQKKKKTALE